MSEFFDKIGSYCIRSRMRRVILLRSFRGDSPFVSWCLNRCFPLSVLSVCKGNEPLVYSPVFMVHSLLQSIGQYLKQ